MSSRQEEKARRKAEREAAEAAAAKSAARKGRLQLAAGALVAVAAIVVAVLVFSGGGGSDGGGSSDAVASGIELPAQQVNDVDEAAKAAGCTLKTYPSEGRGHTTDEVTYKTNPPTSGAHNPEWSEDGIYDAGNTPPIGKLVHTLEHGRIDIQYRPGSDQKTIDMLEALGSEELRFGRAGYHTLVFENPTKMKAAVAATAWTQSLTCPKMTDGVVDAVRTFRTAYTDKGPELIP